MKYETRKKIEELLKERSKIPYYNRSLSNSNIITMNECGRYEKVKSKYDTINNELGYLLTVKHYGHIYKIMDNATTKLTIPIYLNSKQMCFVEITKNFNNNSISVIVHINATNTSGLTSKNNCKYKQCVCIKITHDFSRFIGKIRKNAHITYMTHRHLENIVLEHLSDDILKYLG